MNATELLLQIKKIEKLIKNTKEEIEKWHELAENITANTSDVRVKLSGYSDKVGNSVSEYIDNEKKLQKMLVDLMLKRKSIIDKIEQLQADEYDVLYKIYVQDMKVYEVAAVLDRSYSGIKHIKRNAIKNLQKILDAEEAEKLHI